MMQLSTAQVTYKISAFTIEIIPTIIHIHNDQKDQCLNIFARNQPNQS